MLTNSRPLRWASVTSCVAIVGCGGATPPSPGARSTATATAAAPLPSFTLAHDPEPAPTAAAVASASAEPMVERPPAPPDAARLRFAGKLPEAWTLDGALDVWKGGACAEPGAKVRESTPRTCVDVALVSGRVILSGRVGIAATGGVWFSIGSSAEVLSPKQLTQFGDADITCSGELSPADRLACATTLAIE